MTATIPDQAAAPSATTVSFAEKQQAVRSRLETLEAHGRHTATEVPKLIAEAVATLEALERGGLPNADEEATALVEIAQVLAEKLPSKWSDYPAGRALFFVSGRIGHEPLSLRYIAANVGNWLDNHVDEYDKFNFCLQLRPPAGIAIESVLNAGARKQVFVARWPDVTPHKVAFKHFHDTDGAGSGDAFSHPLRGHHPNIIETFPLENTDDGDDVYLVERLLSTTLEYGWNFGGLGEIVNLLRDIAHALSFVHSYGHLHGDVKLENIGFEGVYILLDFGLCRPEPNETCAWTPTGNVRAMAPELLHGEANTAASDIWALGSVVYAALTERPPFLTPREKQHGFGEGERERKLEKLAERSDDPEWRHDIDRRFTAAVPEIRLRELVMEMLDPDPTRRPSAEQVFQRCGEHFSHFLRPVDPVTQAAPAAELESLLYLQDSGDLSLASRGQRIALRDAARHIDVDRLDDSEKLGLEKLQTEIGPH